MSIVSYLDLALALPATLALAVPEPTPAASGDLNLTPAEALALLPDDQTIHVQVGQDRSRWQRDNVIAAIRGGSDRRLATYALKAGFGLSCVRDTGQSLLIQTDDAKVRGWLERQAKRAGD